MRSITGSSRLTETVLTAATDSCEHALFPWKKLNPAPIAHNHSEAAEPNLEATESAEALALLKSLAEGDASAFWRLWEVYRKYLYSVCLRQMGGIHSDAEDALSRAMLTAQKRLPAYASRIANPKAWLTRLTYNHCMDMHRERKRQSRYIEGLESGTLTGWRIAGESNYSPELAVAHREMCRYVMHHVSGLPSQLRQPFMLRFVQEMAYRDIAKMLALSEDNVRKRIQKARATLRKELDTDLRYVGGYVAV